MSPKKPTTEQQIVADEHADNVCNYCDAWHPVTLAPMGPLCGKPVTKVVFWKDGRFSPSCDDHGLRALTSDTKALVLCEVEITTSCRKEVKR